MIRIAVIIGSTRAARRAELVARWVHEVATDHAGRGNAQATFEVVDLADYELPLLDEPLPAAIGDYQHPHTKRWAETIASFDGFVFVTPEYNHSIPAALKNAIDFLFSEWHDKAAGFVSYGLGGGTRAVEHLRQVMAEVKVADVRTQVALTLHTDFDITDMAEPGTFAPGEHHQPTLIRLLYEVCAWAQALQSLRAIPEAATTATRLRPSSIEGRRVLVIGLSPKVNQSVVEPLRALGIAAEGSTHPDQASEQFSANDFELIVFGRGSLGPLSDRLKSDFTRQNPAIRFVDAIAPVAVKQTVAALTQDPQATGLVTDFRLINEDANARILATVLAPCHVTLILYRAIGEGLEAEVLADDDAEPGPFEQRSDAQSLAGADSLLLTANEDEYHLHPFLETQ